MKERTWWIHLKRLIDELPDTLDFARIKREAEKYDNRVKAWTKAKCPKCGTETELGTYMQNELEIYVWCVWESWIEGHARIEQLRAIDLDREMAITHKKMLEGEAILKPKKQAYHISVEGTTLNHLFAWKMQAVKPIA